MIDEHEDELAYLRRRVVIERARLERAERRYVNAVARIATGLKDRQRGMP